MKMRLLGLVAAAWLAGCASANSNPQDAGVDMTAGHCDSTTLFSSCSDQCHENVCVVTTAMCVGTDWVCSCSDVQACPGDMSGLD